MSRRVDLPKSTVARLLATLEEAGAVERGPDGLTYRVGPTLRGLAASVDGSIGLVEMVRPSLTRLAELTRELGVRIEPNSVLVDSQVHTTDRI